MISGLFSLPTVSTTAAACATTARATAASELFVAGPENALVRAAAEVAVADPLRDNPLVLCGGMGVGKTTLAHALAQQRQERLRLPNLIATTGTDLAQSLAEALELNAAGDLRTRYHRCDILLIDEVHRLVGKPAAQQFLVAAMDTLLRRGSLVIATLRQLPQATAGLAPALASRLAGGLIVPLVAPGALARRELVRRIAAGQKLALSEDLIATLAGGETSRRRITAGQLRQAVLRLAASAEAGGHVVESPDMTHLTEETAPQPKAVCRQVITVVSRHFGLTATQLKGRSREQAIVEARGLAIFLARRLTAASYAEIGKHFGGRDHTTTLHACRKIAALTENNTTVRRLTEELAAQIL